MENLTFNIHDIIVLLGFVAGIWGFYKIIVEISEPRKVLEKRVDIHESWLKENDKRLHKMELYQEKELQCLYALIDHEITGNGEMAMKDLRREVNDFLIKGGKE